MRKSILLIALALFIIGSLFFVLTQQPELEPDSVETENVEVVMDPTPAEIKPPLPDTNLPDPADPRLNRLPDGRVEYKLALETSRQINRSPIPEESLMVIDDLMAHYRYAYKENPVGVDNFEITEQLLGKNPKKIVFIAAESKALRGNELIDQWGTPFFFHAQSGQQMDIRSAGSDKTLWTDDDVFLDQ